MQNALAQKNTKTNITQSKPQRNIFLDLFRFLLSFMVICIHLTAETYSFFPLFRIAVPTFFMISGYFIYSKDIDSEKKKARVFIKRSAKYMLIGIAFYTVYEFISCLCTDTSVGWFFTTLFYEGNSPLFKFFILNAPIPYYTVGAQLWFLIALFVLSLIHFLLVSLNKTHYYKILVPVCFAVYFFFSGFMYIIQPTTDMPIRYMRNAWFFGLPNFGLGYLLAHKNLHKRAWYKYLYLAVALLFSFLQILEHKLIARENSNLEMYITGVIASANFLMFFLGLPKKECNFFYTNIGKTAPFYIYILHMGVAVTLSYFVSFSSLLIKSLVVFCISFAIYECCFLLIKLLSKAKKQTTEKSN